MLECWGLNAGKSAFDRIPSRMCATQVTIINPDFAPIHDLETDASTRRHATSDGYVTLSHGDPE